MLKEICEFIENLGLGPAGGWEIGKDLFAGHIPQKNKNGDDIPIRHMAVLNNAGGATYFDLPDRADLAIQIRNRNKTFFTARDDAFKLYEALHGTAGWQTAEITPYTIMTIEAISTPAAIENPEEETGYFIFNCNYIFRMENPP